VVSRRNGGKYWSEQMAELKDANPIQTTQDSKAIGWR